MQYHEYKQYSRTCLQYLRNTAVDISALWPPKDYVQVCQSMQPPVVSRGRNTVAVIPLAKHHSTLW